jgi:carboxyl-terminal processing protease
MRSPTRTLVLVATAIAVACGGSDSPTGVVTPEPTIAPAARAYLDTALSFMQEYYYYGDTVNWAAKRTLAFQRAGAAQTGKAVYPAIDAAVRELGNTHSTFYPPSQTLGNREDPATAFYKPMSTSLTPRVAYLWVPTFGGKSQLGRADTIQRIVARGDSTPGLCGWVLDLRGNPGGFWPSMLAGLSPLITPGLVGGFVERDVRESYEYHVQPGAAFLRQPNGTMYEYIRLPNTYQLAHPGLPVAILQGDITASAGEIVVMAFKEPDRVRTFGAPTYGATTQPYTWQFADTASLQIAAALMFDRQRRTYAGGRIPVDEPVVGPTIRDNFVPGSRDVVIDAATAWLLARPECATTSPDTPALRNDGGRMTPTRTLPGSVPGSSWPKDRPTPWSAGTANRAALQ